jgi:GT2 family glycosyltransferase
MHFVTEVGQFLFSYPPLRDGQRLGFEHFWGGRCSAKRDFLLREGVFDPVFRFGCEDIELAWRLGQRGLRVMYHAKAVTIASRPFRFDEFCDRLEQQGRSNWVFSRLHAAPEVQRWTQVDEALASWPAVLPAHVAARHVGRELDAAVRRKLALGQSVERDLGRLHDLYSFAFRTSKLKGIAERAAQDGVRTAASSSRPVGPPLPEGAAVRGRGGEPGSHLRVSIVLLTHQHPEELALSLLSLARQSEPADEVIVAEDGSDEGVREVVAAALPFFPGALLHLSQPHLGMRISSARNRGIALSSGDYLVFLDADMVAGPRFVEDHRLFARRGSFAQGSRATTTAAGKRALLAACETDPGVRFQGVRRRRYLFRLPFLWSLFGRPRKDTRGVKGCNMGFFRDDLIRLNGFDETMVGWGREDGELAHRAFHAGMVRRDIRFGAAAVHLWHPSRQPPRENPNDAIEASTVARARVRC